MTHRYATSRLCRLPLALTLAFGTGAGFAQQPSQTIKVGALASMEGAFTVLGQDGMRGMELALKERDYKAGGKTIQLIKSSSNGSPDSALSAARKLVEQDKVDIVVGPTSGSEGIAVKNYARTRPGVTFLNGSSAAQETTLREPAANFFRFGTDGAQWMVGLGSYAVQKGFKKVAVIAEDYAFPYSQVQGFMAEFCKAGGRVVDKAWVPLGTKDYSSVIAKLPDGIDAVYVALGGADAVNFLTQYEQLGGSKPFIGGSITVDQTVLSYKGKRRDALIGTPSASPIADSWDDPQWRKFVAAYKAQFKDGFSSPSLFAHGYYVNTLAMLDALDAVKGDLSNEQAALRKTLATVPVKTPTGEVRLDENRNAIASIFLTEVAKAPDGTLYNKVVKVTPNVNQQLGLSKEDFAKMGLGSRTNPECK
ncbi:ABC transporter substrate-binding protein [Variovorax boronicumulans]|uniref:ABC transporter substrate-binding protein n=1 Tax=Variovorax boronicumulans TaxID=436515 RepID=UPI001C579B47